MSGKYAKAILEGIHNLNEVAGSQSDTIHKYVKHQHPECEIAQVNIQLQKLVEQGHVNKAKRGVAKYTLTKKYLEKLHKEAEKGAGEVIKKAPVSKSKNTKKGKKANTAQKKPNQTKKAASKPKKPVVVQRSMNTRSKVKGPSSKQVKPKSKQAAAKVAKKQVADAKPAGAKGKAAKNQKQQTQSKNAKAQKSKNTRNIQNKVAAKPNAAATHSGIHAKKDAHAEVKVEAKQKQVSSKSKAIKKDNDHGKKAITIKKFDKLPEGAAGKAFTTYKSVHDIGVKTIDGKVIKKLGDILKGKKLTLFVNVASKCGLTKRTYTLMSELYKKYAKLGLEILAFPCNQFGSQEPGTNDVIKKFACERQNAEYPLFDKVDVNGPNAHGLFKFLRFQSELHDPKQKVVGHVHWNFGKFLVDQTGSKVHYFHPQDKTDALESFITELLH